MKFFIVIIHYKLPSSLIAQIRPEHKAYLQKGYKEGKILISGPRCSGMGGIVVAKSDSHEDIVEFFNKDPYKLNDAAVYEFIEFNPGSWQPYIEGWISNE